MSVTVCTTYYAPDGPSPFVESCRHYGIPVRAFGTKRKFSTFLRTKILPLIAFLDKAPPGLVMFVDGSDAFVVSSWPKIEETYKRMTADRPGTVVIGGERVCWPYTDLKPILDERAKTSGSPWRYLDTGLMIGDRDILLSVLRTVAAMLPEVTEQRPGTPQRILEDDVGLWVSALCVGKISPKIDYGCEMIVALRNTEPTDYGVVKHRLMVTATGQQPHIIHCNGHRRIDRARLPMLYEKLLGKKWRHRKRPTNEARGKKK